MKKLLFAASVLLAPSVATAQTFVDIGGWESGEEERSYSGGDSQSNVVTSPVRTGTRALEINCTTTEQGYISIAGPDPTEGHQRDLTPNASPVFYRTYFRVQTAPASLNENLYCVLSAAAADKLCVRINSARQLVAHDAAGTLIATGATALVINDWYRLEVSAANGVSAAYEIRLNGATELSGTANQGASNCGQPSFGKRGNLNSQSVRYQFDDWAVCTGNWCGAGAVALLLPTANGGTHQWTSGTGTSGFGEIDNIPLSTATYVQTNGTATQTSEFDLTDTAAAGITGTVNAVKTWAHCQEAASGTNSLRNGVSASARTGGRDVAASWTWLANVFTTDPSDSAAWTLADVDAVRLHLFENNAVASRCAFGGALVDFNTSGSGSAVPELIAAGDL